MALNMAIKNQACFVSSQARPISGDAKLAIVGPIGCASLLIQVGNRFCKFASLSLQHL
jgi:hypothetical protein